jgi:Tfp pilus assembly ATPase PilU
VLVTGPTGSGKSTTLYSALMEIKDEATKIITVEDPVEYQQAGISQIQVHAKIGLTFAHAPRRRGYGRPAPPQCFDVVVLKTISRRITVGATPRGQGDPRHGLPARHPG